jgi:hypothetical protein
MSGMDYFAPGRQDLVLQNSRPATYIGELVARIIVLIMTRTNQHGGSDMESGDNPSFGWQTWHQ